MNRLSREKAAYLKHSAYQKIDWYPWSDEAFERARQEDKPLFLSSGAVWCHWCHVMAKECFEDEEIIKLLNENFVNIKIDRDERPDVDRIYQQAVAVIGGGGGWPLSVFLSPDKKPFFGGTYFPPEDKFGKPGFKKVLKVIINFYKSNREEISEYTGKLMNSLAPKPILYREISGSIVDNAVENILSEFDPQNSGFGAAPKFPMTGAIEFLINRYFLTQKESIGYAVRKTLESMAKGGFYDQIGGGFHRYSTDEAWIVPHFEKMADDNAWLLRNYIAAYSVFGDKYFREVAEGIINFIRDVLSDTEGGFYASQDADVTPDDEGGYFTWTVEDLKKVLDAEEYKVLSLHLLHERGAMHHNAAKKVLFVSMDEKEIVRETGVNLNRVDEIIRRGKEKLLKARGKREAPLIDRTIYTSLNGMLITAYLNAFRVLRDEGLRDFALKSLERIIRSYFINNELFHSEGVKALLEDYIYLIESLTVAYEVTGDFSYLDKADALMELCIDKFWDKDEGGFFNTDARIIGIRLKGIEDLSHPSANSLGIILLLKLYHIMDKNAYYQYAEKALKVFSSKAESQGLISGYYFSALDAYFNILKLTLHTTDVNLISTALSSFSPYTSIAYSEDKGYVLPCLGAVCCKPVYKAEDLEEFLKSRKQKK